MLAGKGTRGRNERGARISVSFRAIKHDPRICCSFFPNDGIYDATGVRLIKVIGPVTPLLHTFALLRNKEITFFGNPKRRRYFVSAERLSTFRRSFQMALMPHMIKLNIKCYMLCSIKNQPANNATQVYYNKHFKGETILFIYYEWIKAQNNDL